MFARRVAFKVPKRALSTHSRPLVSRKGAVVIASGVALTVTLAFQHLPSAQADDLASVRHNPLKPDITELQGTSTSLAALVRAYAVYSMCSVPLLVDLAP